MKIPLQINFRDMPVSPALESLIREKAAKLEQFHPNLTGCRVVVDKPHQHSQQGDRFSVTVDVSVPGATIVANNASNEDANVAVRDAFMAARRQVEDHVKRQRAEVRQAAGRAPAAQAGLDGAAVAGVDGAIASGAGNGTRDPGEVDAGEPDGDEDLEADELETGELDVDDRLHREAPDGRSIGTRANNAGARVNGAGAPGL